MTVRLIRAMLDDNRGVVNIKKSIVISAGIIAGLVVAVMIVRAPEKRVQIPPVFTGDSTGLERTVIIPTLDAPFVPAKNTIWCASMVAAWKALENDVLDGTVKIEGVSATADSMNAAADPAGYINPENLYAAAGRIDAGIIETINDGLGEKFPDKTKPEFESGRPEDIIAYAYLEVHLRFEEPYPVNPDALAFTDAEGDKTLVTSFGILEHDPGRLNRAVLYKPEPLFESRDDLGNLTEFAVDLDRNSYPNQIIAVMI